MDCLDPWFVHKIYRVMDLSLSLRRESEVRDFIEAGREFQSLMAEG